MKKLILFCLLTTGIFTASYRQPAKNEEAIDRIYLQQIDSFDHALTNLKECISYSGANSGTSRKAFLKTRIAYKKIAVLSDYLDPYESLQLNSPAIERTEDDNPDIIIKPAGLQMMESIAWENENETGASQKLLDEIDKINDVIQQLKTGQDRVNKFTGEKVWQAMRFSLVSLITKTLTSFDSPISLNGLAESKVTLESLKEYLAVYQVEIEQTEPGQFKKIIHLIDEAILKLNAPGSFNAFNRISFIREKINPISEQLTVTAIALHYINPNERRPLNVMAKNIFSPNAFDADFFSPNKRYAATTERITLGRKLFSDKRLSSNGTRACSSCHKPDLAFTDGLRFATAIDERSSLKRNTPTLLNAVYQTKQFYDSRQTMLEFQVDNVVHNEREMGGSTEKFAGIIKEDKKLYEAFEKAYPGEKEPANPYTIANAISSYMRSLQSLNSRFDKYMRNQPVTFSKEEKNGFNLFMGKAKCGTCHFMPLFNGLVPPNFNETESEVLGVPASLNKPYQLDSDSGKYYFTRSVVHLNAFKTPTLRNIALTSPYMHNGVYKTLEEVMEFYNNGGGKGLDIAPPNQTLPFEKLELTKKEIKDIIRFLQTLTDTTSYKQLP